MQYYKFGECPSPPLKQPRYLFFSTSSTMPSPSQPPWFCQQRGAQPGPCFVSTFGGPRFRLTYVPVACRWATVGLTADTAWWGSGLLRCFIHNSLKVCRIIFCNVTNCMTVARKPPQRTVMHEVTYVTVVSLLDNHAGLMHDAIYLVFEKHVTTSFRFKKLILMMTRHKSNSVLFLEVHQAVTHKYCVRRCVIRNN
jgi:hypothetical protein